MHCKIMYNEGALTVYIPPPPMANRREADVARSLRPRIEGEEGVEVGVGMRLDSGSRGGECIEPPDMGGGAH